MPDAILTPVHALAGAPAGHFGATDGDTSLTLTAPPEGTILLLMQSGDGEMANVLTPFGAFDLRPLAPGQHLAIADEPATPSKIADITAALAGKADVVDQSAARVRFIIEGASVRDTLAKGVAVDLHPDVFGPGHAVTTLCGHLGVHLTCTQRDCFEIIVTRSYAVALWESIIEMGLEYGIGCHHV